VKSIDWDAGRWTNQPASVREEGTDLLVTAVEGSDAWRTTSYGFVHDTEHALVVPLENGRAVEVDFVAEFSEQFDQAGVFLRADDRHWIKAGVEFVDGAPQVGAVVTWPNSDWSASPVPGWAGRTVTIRASRSGDAVTFRAGVDGQLALIRLAPVPPDATLEAGPMVCAPTRAGLTVRFTGWRETAADASLHDQ
jgi:regulation of enolase protein 1 (concanavalin A-like superfamily)